MADFFPSSRSLTSWLLGISVLGISVLGLFLLAGCGHPAGGDSGFGNEPLSEIEEPERRLALRMEVEGLLGETEDGEKGLLGRPTGVRVDSEGNIYVADQASVKIKVYDRSGALLRELGGRGREPGRFMRIEAFHIDREDRVIVADGNDRQLTVLSKTGELLFEHPMDLETMLWPRSIQQLQDGRFAFVYRLPKERRDGTPWPQSEYFVHLYDQDLQERQGVLATVEDFGPVDHFLNDAYSQIWPGHIWQRRDGSILYAPGLYRGEIHVYRQQDGEWRHAETWDGYVAQDPPLVEVDAEAQHNYFNVQITNESGKRAARIRNQSRGIFELTDGRVVHFTVLTAGKDSMEVMFGAEIFSPEGELEGYGVLPQITDHHHTEQFYIDWKDEEDRFYVREATDRFVVWIARLTQGGELDGPVWGVRPASDHGAMNHGETDHGNTNHGNMNHGNMNHGNMEPADEEAPGGDP
ncbi:MAG: 6-bladed beta-propeller [Acidobacteriota bacterium]|nr:6-bladed beta-propeller [Acidobacteriota bacterium]